MSRPTGIGADAAPCPEDVLGWIAWYPDGGLTEAQCAAVEAHAAGCAACRDEIAMLAETGAASDAPGDGQDRAERIWADVQARIELEDQRDAVASRTRQRAAPTAPTAETPLGDRTGARRTSRAPVMRLAAMLALALALGAAGAWVAARTGGADAPAYRTATSSSTPSVATAGASVGVAFVDVVFDEQASAGQVADALRGIGAQVVSGPSGLGVYRIALPATRPSDAAAAAADQLRASEWVLFAEVARP